MVVSSGAPQFLCKWGRGDDEWVPTAGRGRGGGASRFLFNEARHGRRCWSDDDGRDWIWKKGGEGRVGPHGQIVQAKMVGRFGN
jgi:hypothetical protein